MKALHRIAIPVLLLLSFLALTPAMGQIIHVTSPTYRSDVHGDTTIRIQAAGLSGPVVVKSWAPNGDLGSDTTIATITLDKQGDGSFLFHADQAAHGPITLRISGTPVAGHAADTCYLQLYNTGGIAWNEGIPAQTPPGAAGMTLAFQDDFNGPLSISATGEGTRYAAHKPDGKDFSQIPFVNPTPAGPFFQRDTYLLIRANALLHSTGLISSVGIDGKGFTVKAPYYMECRFIAPDAVGAWPAWWTMTDEYKDGKWGEQTDEIDTIEAYGGDGPKNPNAPTSYMITPHTWGYKFADDQSRPIPMPNSTGWAYTPHTYGLLVTLREFVFYLDNVEVLRLPAYPRAIRMPSYFMVNLAIGGSGWPVDLSRYGNIVDMYVDYVRVYEAAAR